MYAVAACRSDRCKTDTRVARGRLDDDRALHQLAALLSVVDHSLGNSVLDRSCGIEVLKLCKQLCLEPEFLFDTTELEKRSFAYKLISGCIDVCHDKYLLFSVRGTAAALILIPGVLPTYLVCWWYYTPEHIVCQPPF